MHVVSTVWQYILPQACSGTACSPEHILFIDLLLHVEPSNMQAQSLKALIDQAETREGYIGKQTSVESPFILQD